MSGTPDKKMLESAPVANQPIGIKLKCSRCKKLKTPDNFSPDTRKSRGFYSACKECHNKARLEKRGYIRRPKGVLTENRKGCLRRSAKKRRSTPAGKLSHSISTAVYRSLCGNKKGKSWENLVGYTVNQLKTYLSKKLKKGMTWENYGEWHIDHKIPVSAFNFETSKDSDFKRCWELKNLQPMWAMDNHKKNAKLDKPFQPSLTI